MLNKKIKTWFRILGNMVLFMGILALRSSRGSELIRSEDGQRKRMTHLAHEKSPYLRLHAKDLVEWYPWSDEAFEKAKKEDKPIFLSIGYSACHWCHVMQEESFQDPEVARLLNQTFVCILVDREERPDLDAVYMTVCQALTGTGGWPLTLFLTPDKVPFFAATFLPKEDRWGRMGLKNLALRVQDLWAHHRAELLASASKIQSSVTAYLSPLLKPSKSLNPESLLLQSYQKIQNSFDPEYGGFGYAPKFPNPHSLLFLLRIYDRTHKPRALQMVETTLKAMRFGGIYDQVGGGFHRYATDRFWHFPHFEKMLYDQAMLLFAYAEAYAFTKEALYLHTAREIVAYVTRELRESTSGAFYASQDADSEGKEGTYYLWSWEQLQEVLSPREFEWLKRFFALYGDSATSGGVLAFRNLSEKIHDFHGQKWETFESHWRQIRERLFMVRSRRVPPATDQKILTDWNGLMIAALAYAGRLLGDSEMIQEAQVAARAILQTLNRPDGLYHRAVEGEVAIPGMLDDYANLTWGMLELYEATYDPIWLQEADQFAKVMIQKFWDAEAHAFSMVTPQEQATWVRPKSLSDGAYPSGNAVALGVLLRLAHLTGNPDWETLAHKSLRALAPRLQETPEAFLGSLCALNFAAGPTREIVVVGPEKSDETRRLLLWLQRRVLPRSVVLFRPDPSTHRTDVLQSIAPFVASLSAREDLPTVYLCQNFQCDLPLVGLEALKQRLKTSGAP